MAALETDYENLAPIDRTDPQLQNVQRSLLVAARQRLEAAAREERDSVQRRRDCELLLAQRRYTRPEEGDTPVNEPQLEHIRDCIRSLLDQTLDCHLQRQRDEGRPAPLPQMWREATLFVQLWYPDQPRAMVSASLHWNRSREQFEPGRADDGDAHDEPGVEELIMPSLPSDMASTSTSIAWLINLSINIGFSSAALKASSTKFFN